MTDPIQPFRKDPANETSGAPSPVSATQRHAAQLFSTLSTPPKLSTRSRLRIEANLLAPGAAHGRMGLWSHAAAPGLIAVVVGIGAVASATTMILRGSEPSPAEVEVEGVAAVEAAGDEPMLLRDGALVLRAHRGPSRLRAPGAEVIVARGGRASVRVENNTLREVRAISGETKLLFEGGAEVALLPGERWANGPHGAGEGAIFAAQPDKAGKTDKTKKGAKSGSPTDAPSGESWAKIEVESESSTSEEAANILKRARESIEQKDPETALEILEDEGAPFETEALREQALDLRVQALLDLGDRGAALEELDEAPLGKAAKHARLLARRGELRSGANRFADAVEDFTTVLHHYKPKDGDVPTQLLESALYQRGLAELHRGENLKARADFMLYLQRYPDGVSANDARTRLQEGRLRALKTPPKL